MKREILVNKTSMETRVALIENTELDQLCIDRGQQQTLVGNIYQAKVLRVMPGMQAAFIDIGDERSGFLPLDGIHLAASDDDIQNLLHAGQIIVVQVLKDPAGNKGALLTTDLSIATKYLVYRHSRDSSAVSLKIKDETERKRLSELLNLVSADLDRSQNSKLGLSGSFILRTSAEGVSAEQLASDVSFFKQLWKSLQNNKTSKAPFCLHREPPLYQVVIRDIANLEVTKIWVDCPQLLKDLTKFANQFCPQIKPLIEYYSECTPLFQLYQTDNEINSALNRQVPLNCGGSLVIDELEAMTVIDVNTGAFIGRNNYQQTLFEANLEAAQVAAKQIRIRNLSGIIIVDFIDMENTQHRHGVLKKLKQELTQDRVKATVSGVTELGLVQITRRRSSQSLKQLLCEPCASCDAKGVIKSAETLSYEILREIIRITETKPWKRLKVFAIAEVVEKLQDEDIIGLADIETKAGCKIELCVESSLPRGQFNIIPV